MANQMDDLPKYKDWRTWREDAERRIAAGEPHMAIMFDRPCYYDLDGRALSMREWGEKFESRVPTGYGMLKTILPNGRRLSTAWLGLDHAFTDGPPLIFETMCFEPNGQEAEFPDPETGEPAWQLRYHTQEQARLAHESILAKLGLDRDGNRGRATPQW